MNNQELGRVERKSVSFEWFVAILKNVFSEDGFGIDAYFDVRNFSNAVVSKYDNQPFYLALANLIWVEKLTIPVWSTQDPRRQQGHISFTSLGEGLNALAKDYPQEFSKILGYEPNHFNQVELGLFLSYVIHSK